MLSNFLWFMFGAAVVMSFEFWFKPDSTDKDWWTRSGLRLYTDHLTGIQYIGPKNGSAITPRLDSKISTTSPAVMTEVREQFKLSEVK